MCKEESSCGIVWIGVGFREFVMDSMIAGPADDGSLVCDGVEEH